MAYRSGKDPVGRLASRQFGRIAWRQLRELGVAKTMIALWIQGGYLHRKLPGVYAVGHDAPNIEADLAAALLYAGPGAMLSHGTAAWWYGLIERPPRSIHVSTPRKRRSLRGITVHQRRPCERTSHRDLPITTVAQALLDHAGGATLNEVRVALAKAEHQQLLEVPQVEALLGQGRPGSAKLRTALTRHQPRLAYARSPTEVAFFALCESFGIPLPKVNARVGGWTVDFFWRREGVVVEVDGHGNHHTPAQVDRDRRKDLALRTRGLAVNRYSRPQVEQAGETIARDVIATLTARSPAGT